MEGYLLDTNTLSRWFSQNEQVVERINALPEDCPLFVSVICLGEIECGHCRTAGTDPSRRKAFEDWLRQQFPLPLGISRHTAKIYGEIKAEIFQRFPPQGKKSRRPEQCYDKVLAVTIDIDENDLWMVAQAIEHNLTFVTNDKMRRIVGVAGGQVKIEDWETKARDGQPHAQPLDSPTGDALLLRLREATGTLSHARADKPSDVNEQTLREFIDAQSESEEGRQCDANSAPHKANEGRGEADN